MTKDQKITLAVFAALVLASVVSYIIFYKLNIILFYYDASSRLNIARKLIDNLTPGIGQIGTLWLPLPQLLMLPFIWVNQLWRTGFAGSIVSMVSFVLSGMFIFKAVQLWSQKYWPALLSVLLYITNINTLYMQATPMSEPFFIMTLLGSMYFFMLWVTTDKINHLLPFAFFVSLATLTRYEGYFTLAFSFVMVLVVLAVKKNPLQSIEGKLLLFTTLATTGVMLWTIYQAAIFRDPIYWLKVYTQQASIISTEQNRLDTLAASRGGDSNLLVATTKTFNTGAQINGIVLTYFALACLAIVLIWAVKKRRTLQLLYCLAFLSPLGAFLFMVVAINGGFPLDVPALSWQAMFTPSNHYFEEYNIRYGLILVPFVTLLIGFFASLNRATLGVALGIVVLQLAAYFYPNIYLQYNIPQYFMSRPVEARVENGKAFNYLKQNYDGGLILVSALKHDSEMFYLSVDYKNFIHEGTQRFWKESIKNPQTYATWVYMFAPGITEGREEDSVTKELKDNPNLLQHFELVYKDNQYHVYKRKNAL